MIWGYNITLEVKDVVFGYREKKVLDGFTFTAEGNKIISILGPNGVGKTTLLKCICGFITPQSGSVMIDDKNVREMSARELAKHIGYVPQKCPVPRTTVFDAVLIGRRPYIEWSVTNRDLEITWNALDSLGLTDLALRYADEISGGEFQKVQIARAIVQEPNVLILDEPTNNLDIANQHMTMHMVLDAVNSKGICTIMTMHDINLAVHYSDLLMFVKDGKIAGYGGPDIVTEELIHDVYGMDVDIIDHMGTPFVIPKKRYEHIHKHPHKAEDHLVDGYSGMEFVKI
ncbi:ABC transporter ATP-binding protein [Candidatus Methanomassiliicoccus intestinalis]|uniref:ABC transporter ATP-binding protein n=2 Tax=Candidatus Methanomassiliicoccus intestinalis TaxID=1406512 RepID=UPI0037DD38D3